MQDKLELLLKKIELESEYYSFFNTAKLEKIKINKNTKEANFIINTETNIDIDLYNHLKEKIKNSFNEYNVSLTIKPNKCDIDLLKDYYKYYLEIKIQDNPLLNIFIDSIIDIDSDIKIEVANKAEEMRFEKIKKEIENDLFSVGYDYKVNIIINDKLENEIKKEIENDLNKSYVKKEEVIKPKSNLKIVDSENVIVGKEIDDISISINNITEPIKSVTIEGYLFSSIEVRDTKTELKILTLKITDDESSIYGKMFVNNEADKEYILSNIKLNNYYKFQGEVKDDLYSKELIINIKNINKSNKKMNEIKDLEKLKRVELHAHTMMSAMDGVTKLDLGKHTCELVEKAIEMGYKGVAITDHSGCQAFPISYSIIKSHNKKIRNDIKEKIENITNKLSEENENKKELEEELERLKEEQKNPPIFKGLYGVELSLVDDEVKIVYNMSDADLIKNTYVVFDTETTGFNASHDQMIEIGAVKIKEGNIIDRFDELINPGYHIPDRITELTCITDEMVQNCDNEENVTKKFLEWTGNLPMVAHNAKFDISFIEMAMKKYNLGEFKNTVIDTLELSRTLDQGFARHSLSALVKRYNVPFDEDAHHRADYDAEGTALVFSKMLDKLKMQKFEKISDLDKLISKDEIYKFGRTYHFNMIALNKEGLKNLFKIISLANTKYLYKTPRILRSELNNLRKGIIIGSGCYESEVFKEARSKDKEELTNIINFYDYVEVQPKDIYSHLLETGDFSSETELEEHIKHVINATKEAGKIIVATGDVHHFYEKDKIYREIIINQKVPGGGRHPLCKKEITKIPSQHFRTTEEMLNDFSFLDKDLAYEIVVTNTNKILDMVDEIEVIPDTGGTPFSPRVKNDDGTYIDCQRVVTDLVYEKAKEWYGTPLPYSIEERIATELYGDIVLTSIKYDLKDKNLNEDELKKESFKILHETLLKGYDYVCKKVLEYLSKTEDGLTEDELNKKLKKVLGGIIGAGFDPIYLIAQRLVKHSNDEGFLVGSRGSVGSSFVATLMGITEVNPLSAHYRCEKCKLSIFEEKGIPLGKTYNSGFDLPDKKCPNCKTKMIKDGQDMPFATFLGFNADKVPDIDLNFSDLNQASTHAYTKVLFGENNVYRAGTIGTVADKTAFGFVKGYCEDKNLFLRTAEVERLALGCTGVKRTTGQHPGGIVVIPDYMDCFDFTPYQYPAEDVNSAWKTTHFDYHSIEECVLKLDILGHSDPTQLRLIQLQSNTDIKKVPLDDKDTMSIFTSTKVLGVSKEQIMCNTGTLGIPEFGTPFTIKLVEDTKPTTFAELVKISGLSHGTDVWLGNAQDLILKNIVPFKEVIGCRDDIMVYLMYHGLPPIKAFKIMEFVRKGKASKDKTTWAEHKKTMMDANIPSWFIDSCEKIKYMFPKAHAAAYVISAFRIAWYKVHMPVYFYASWFSSKAVNVDVDAMIRGYNKIKERILEIQAKGNEMTNKEDGQLESLKISLEATARGIKFLNIDLNKSEATIYLANEDNTIYPPFNSIDGLGDTVALNIVEERKIRPFISIEDLQKRAKISSTLIEKMRLMGILDNLDESSQLSLF